MNMPFKDPGGRKLLDEIQILTIVLSTAIILVVQIVSMFIISYSMGSTMKQDAERVANELVSFLVEPLYNIDDQQASRISESLLLSGRLSGITLVSTASGTLISEMRSEDSRYIEPITREIRRDNLILGTVVLHFSDKEITATKNQFIFIGILIMAAVIAVNLIVNRLFLQKRMLGSLQAILEGIASIRSGDYTSRIKGSEYTDVNMLVTLINEMSASILAKNSQLLEANTLLEGRVAERTTELSKSLAELRQAQDRLVESGKLSALGLLSAGMAHELNTPLGAILSSNRNVIDFFDSKMQGFRDFFLSLSDREYALYTNALAQGGALSRSLDVPEVDRSRQKEIRAILEERGVQDSRAVTDYLVDLGLDPDDSVLGPLLVENRTVEVLTAVSDLLITRRMAEIVDIAGKKAATVVSALRFYLSTDHEDMQATVDIEQDIDKILTLMHNMLKHGVTIKREYSGVRTKGSSDKLGQVWMNILRNAAQAMDFKGEIIIRTQTQDALTIVSFIDSGPGISDDILPRVFDPFFTTKKQGEGMGLGLDICRRIIESHKGTIELETRPGRTEFRIILPAI